MKRKANLDGTARSDAPGSPLATTLERLGRADPDLRLVAGPPDGPGWMALAELQRDPAVLQGWIDHVRATSGAGIDAVTGSFLSSWLSGVVVGPLAQALIRDGRAWPMDAADLYVHRHDDGWFDGLAIASPTVWMLHGDPAAAHHDAVVFPDHAQLRHAAMIALGRALSPVFAAIRQRTRLGIPIMWGAVGDGIGWAALADADAHDEDRRRALARAVELIDVLAQVAPMPRVRPSVLPTSPDGPPEMVRGTCCLWYRTQPDPDPRGEGYCESCPRRELGDLRPAPVSAAQ